MTGRPQRPRGGDGAAALLLVAPALALCAVFVFYPGLAAIVGSAFEYRFTSTERTFVGLKNFAALPADPVFRTAIANNLLIVGGSILLQVGIGTLLAAVLDRGVRRGGVVLRTVFFAPVVISSVAVSLIWLVILDPNVGLLSAAVRAAGLSPPMLGWLGDPGLAIWFVVLVTAWQWIGFVMVLVLAGLQTVPRELYEAASLDGSRGLTTFVHVTLPAIANVMIVAVLIVTIGSFKAFEYVYVLTQGGPSNATQVLGTYVYDQAFKFGNVGYANAIAVVLLAIAVGLGVLQLRLSRGR